MQTEPCATLSTRHAEQHESKIGRPPLTPQVPLQPARRTPSRAPGDDARLLPRHRDQPSLERRRLERAQAQAVLESLTTSDEPLPLRHELTKPGDADALRGIPAIGRSVAGAIPGSNPEQETIKRLMRADSVRQRTAA